MSRHRPSLPAYGGLGGSIAAHHAELPRRACEVCGAGYFGRGPRCPAHAAPYGVEAEAPQGPHCPRCNGPMHQGLCAERQAAVVPPFSASDFAAPAKGAK